MYIVQLYGSPICPKLKIAKSGRRPCRKGLTAELVHFCNRRTGLVQYVEPGIGKQYCWFNQFWNLGLINNTVGHFCKKGNNWVGSILEPEIDEQQ